MLIFDKHIFMGQFDEDQNIQNQIGLHHAIAIYVQSMFLF